MPAPASSTQPFPHVTAQMIPDWLQEGWSSPNGWKIRLAHLAYRYQWAPWLLFWASAAGAAVMASCNWIDRVGQLCPGVRPLVWRAGFAGLLGLWSVAAAFIVAISGWFGVRFRYVAWGTAALSGTVARALRAHWRALLLLAFLLLMVQVDYGKIEAFSKVSESGWNLLAVVLAILAAIFLISLFWTVYQTRNRIIIEEIKNHTGCPELEACAKGLSERLRGELAGLAHLYGLINRSQGSRSRRNVYTPSIDIQDAGGLLESAVSSEATLDLKFFKVPIGAVLAVGSRLLQGARVGGSLHRYEGRLVLVAQMTGGGGAAGITWRVETEDLDEEDQRQVAALVLDRMIEQLAYRIAADVVSVGSRKWRAVRHFTQGLRAYRDSQGTKNSKPRLLQAELAFLEALSEDQDFAQCHYNLGIVYGELGKGDAADAAFRRALGQDTEPSGACYALGARYFDDKRFADALWFSRNAIRILPDDPQAWHLYAMSLYYGRVRPETEAGRPGGQEDWNESLEAEAQAVGIAWRNFCRWRMKGRSPDRAEMGLSSVDHRQTAAAFIGSLANGYLLREWVGRREQGQEDGPVPGQGWTLAEGRGPLQKGRRTPDSRRAWSLIRQAARLAPEDAEDYFSWAGVLWKTGDLPRAAQMLDRVFAGRLEEEGDRLGFWSLLLATHSALTALGLHPEEREITRDAFDELLDAIAAQATSLDDLLRLIQKAADRLEQALVWATKGGKRGAEAWVARLDEILEELQWRQGETRSNYDRRLPFLELSDPAAEPACSLWRLRNIGAFLLRLRRLPELCTPETPGSEGEPWQVLQRYRETRMPYLQARLEALTCARLPESKEEEVPGFGPLDLVTGQRRDWEWACAQMAIWLGLDAHRCLQSALESLEERQHRHQIAAQHLRSRLAEVFLREARTARDEGDLDRWTDLLRQGVPYAEKGVDLEPDGSEEHEILGKLYFELGDYQRAEEEWKICRVVNPDSKAVNLLAEAVWRQALDLPEAPARRQAFERAVKMFEEARELTEKDSSSSPEAHGQVHFWLGVFHRELLQFEQAIFNHKIAWSLGVRSLEARTSLGWAYLEAGMYGEARATFLEVWKQAEREFAQRKPEPPKDAAENRASEPGQEMPLDEIMLRILLGRALHDAELGVRLGAAEGLIRKALTHARGVRSYKRPELVARCYECRGLIALQRYETKKGSPSDLDVASRELQRALHLHARCDTHLFLARVHLNQGKALAGSDKKEEMKQARQECERARRADLRARRDQEIEDLRRRIDEEEKAAAPGRPRPAKPGAAGSSTAPASGPAPSPSERTGGAARPTVVDAGTPGELRVQVPAEGVALARAARIVLELPTGRVRGFGRLEVDAPEGQRADDDEKDEPRGGLHPHTLLSVRGHHGSLPDGVLAAAGSAPPRSSSSPRTRS